MEEDILGSTGRQANLSLADALSGALKMNDVKDFLEKHKNLLTCQDDYYTRGLIFSLDIFAERNTILRFRATVTREVILDSSLDMGGVIRIIKKKFLNMVSDYIGGQITDEERVICSVSRQHDEAALEESLFGPEIRVCGSITLDDPVQLGPGNYPRNGLQRLGGLGPLPSGFLH
jgi:hypothetical protein